MAYLRQLGYVVWLSVTDYSKKSYGLILVKFSERFSDMKVRPTFRITLPLTLRSCAADLQLLLRTCRVYFSQNKPVQDIPMWNSC